MLTIIIGKDSNLSRCISKNSSDTVLYSSRELGKNVKLLDTYKDVKFNIIFNNFQSANLLNDTSKAEVYVKSSIGITALVLDYIKEFNVNKIIYTSSSSVYGDNSYCSETDNLHPISIHASLKISNEFLVSSICMNNNIDYTIIRIFNMYGGDDSFSVISKIIDSYKQNKVLNVINNGRGIRDFIHINDVVYIILKLLKISNVKIINIGTGKKKSVKEILNLLSINNFNIKTKNINNYNEIKVSISNNRILSEIMEKEFINIEDYILEKIGKNRITCNEKK